LKFGPSHIVWADENFENHNIEYCLKECDKPDKNHDYPEWEVEIIRRSLKEPLKIPEKSRCIEPEDYDDEHPELFPPKVEVIRK
jgi:hypothetical protein